MAIVVAEAHKSRAESVGDQSQIVYVYVISGSDDKTAIKAAVLAIAPATAGGLLQLKTYSDEQLGYQIWKATVTYSSEKREDNTSSYSFDTTGGNVHKDVAIAQTVYGHHEYGSPDFKNAIGVDADRRVAGVDVQVPAFQYQETHYLPAASVTLAYAKTLASLTGSVNDAAWKGWAAGEVLFAGVTGQQDKPPDGQWQLTFKFVMEPNQELTPPGDITGGPIVKKGHDYLWVYFGEEKDDTAKRIIPRPHAACVAQVYPYTDFSTIGIGS